jgi:hypothetical protein
MKKLLRVTQNDGTSVVQVNYCNDNRLSGRFAGVTVLKGPALTFGSWLFIFKKEILEKFSEDVERVLQEYNDFYRKARIEAREMFREEENVRWSKTAIRTTFEKYIGESGCIDYKFIQKIYTDPMFETGNIHIETFHVSMCGKVNRKPPKHIFVLCSLWKKFKWNQFVEPVSYTEFESKEYDWTTTGVSVTDIMG